MADFTVVGSGPSGVHFALSALKRGHSVQIVDVGWSPNDAVNPGDSFVDLKHNLDDPAAYFLGQNNEGVLLPGDDSEFYGIPPSKAYALRSVAQFDSVTHNFEPLVSFARGGLAEMWTGGCYAFNDAELEDFPFGYDEIAPYYRQIAERIGINGMQDDLSDRIPIQTGFQPPLRLDNHSALLLSRYESKRKYFQDQLGCRVGRARHAVLSQDLGERKSCQYLGRCLWGCPSGSIYTPATTLNECMAYSGFQYSPDRYISNFNYDDSGHIKSLLFESPDGGMATEMPIQNLVLAAGTLGTSRLVLESVFRKTGQIIRLPGLMDNRQILVPFLNLSMLGKAYQPNSYQYNQLAMGFDSANAKHYVHCMVTALKTAMIHPIVEKLPFDLKTALHLFRNFHAALGLVNVNFHDTRRDDCYLTLDAKSDTKHPKLMMHYSYTDGEGERLTKALRRVKKTLLKLGCVVPPGMVHVRPMGASVHYAGTFPMSDHDTGPWTSTRDCRSNDFKNLIFADGSTYPFLPAKNTTFTLMANAVRIAENL